MMIGEILGNRYEILEKIGEGGMSVVYKARCNKLNRNVAVKVLKSELSDNDEIVSKFKKEATSIATLSDNNIVNVLDVGTQENINYIVMEFIDGKTLKDVIKDCGKLNYDLAITIAIQIAKALECAHKNNIIHRDVKPQNILVTNGGIVKVTDFGIAKYSTSETLTNTTTIMGSAHYFSPEQAKGNFLDARTDLYSLGVVLYEMVTGKLPFEGDSPVTIALKHIQDEVVPPKQLNPKIPDSLNRLIIKAVEKDAGKRYQTAREMINDLEKIKEDPDTVIDTALNNNDHTIIMDSIIPTENNISENDNIENDYYDNEEDNDYEYDDYSEDNNSKKKFIIGVVAVISVLIAIGVGTFFVLGGGSSDNNQVNVPDISGMTVEEAKAQLENNGLIYEEAGREESDEVEGTVLDYNPKNIMVKKGSKIRVIVSIGKEKVKMPNVIGETIEVVESFAKKHNLGKLSVSSEYSESIPKGKIISTNPKAGEHITLDTNISVVISKGSKNIEVPNVRGNKMLDAQAELESRGFNVDINYKNVTDEASDGIVLSQSIVNESVEEGTTITITIGKYEKPKIEIGRYLQKGMGYSAVMNALNSLGHNININAVGPTDGILIDWDPKGNVSEGTTVTVTFGPQEKPNEDIEEQEVKPDGSPDGSPDGQPETT